MANGKDNSGSERLSHDAIVAKALQLADRDGIENVSMRKLAAEFGRTAMALYRYFDSAEQIHAEVVALAFTEVDTAAIPGERWDDTMRRTTASIRAMYLAHARANLMLVEGAGDSPALQAHTTRVYNLHAAQGIPPQVLEKAWRIIDAFLTGFIANETDEMHAAERRRAQGLREDEEPLWRTAVSQAYSDEAFEDGMNIILSGIAAMAGPESETWRTPLA